MCVCLALGCLAHRTPLFAVFMCAFSPHPSFTILLFWCAVLVVAAIAILMSRSLSNLPISPEVWRLQSRRPCPYTVKVQWLLTTCRQFTDLMVLHI